MHILLCKYYSKDDSRNAPKRLRKTVFRFETIDPERREGRGQGHHRGGGEGVGSREINEGRGRVGGEVIQRGRGGGGRGRGRGGRRQHRRERGRARARRQTVSDILVDACHGLDQACKKILPPPGQGQYSL